MKRFSTQQHGIVCGGSLTSSQLFNGSFQTEQSGYTRLIRLNIFDRSHQR